MGESESPYKKLIIKIYSSYPQKTNIAQDSKTVSKGCELKNKKGYYAQAIWVDIQNSSSTSEKDSTNSKIEYQKCDHKMKKKDDLYEECKMKRKMKDNVGHMDSYRKMQCWTLVKRLMVGRDAWIFKKSFLDEYKNLKKEKITGLQDIESKLKRYEYSKVDEFENDVRIVFSYAFQFPPKSEIHRIARKNYETFRGNWKDMKKKWMLKEKENKRICN